MPRGLPDYYNPDTLVSQRVVDLTSIITAISKVTPIDGRGRMWFADTFGEGLSRWQGNAGGTGVAPVLSTELAEIAPGLRLVRLRSCGRDGLQRLAFRLVRAGQ